MVNSEFSIPSLISREAELAQICQILAGDGDFLLVGTPGSGRRTLLQQAACQANARLLEIDCLRATSASQFLRLLAQGLGDRFCAPREVALIQHWVAQSPRTLTLTDKPSLALTWSTAPGKEWAVFEALLSLPQYLAEQLDCRVVMVFQNFPHLRSWDRQGKWESYLRQEIQRQTRVSYALVATVVEPWVIASQLAVLQLLPLSPTAMKPWILEAMAAKGLTFDVQDQALELFLSYAQGHLGDALALARRIWLEYLALGKVDGRISAPLVRHSMTRLVADLAVTFEALLLLLPPSQVRVLESLALDPTDSPQSRTYIKKHQLSRGGGLQGALNGLAQKGLIYGPEYGYRIALPLFDFWLKQRLGEAGGAANPADPLA